MIMTVQRRYPAYIQRDGLRSSTATPSEGLVAPATLTTK
jgi:hypothetical protein